MRRFEVVSEIAPRVQLGEGVEWSNGCITIQLPGCLPESFSGRVSALAWIVEKRLGEAGDLRFIDPPTTQDGTPLYSPRHPPPRDEMAWPGMPKKPSEWIDDYIRNRYGNGPAPRALSLANALVAYLDAEREGKP